MKQNTVIIYYKYTPLARPKNHLIQQRAICSEFGLKGRVLIAPEGINGTLEGSRQNIQSYIEYMNNHEQFHSIRYKFSQTDVIAFPKLIVKVRKEIVTAKLGDEDINPWDITGEYLTAEQLQAWYDSNKKFTIVDMRNGYEQAVGMFKNSIRSGMTDFKDLSKVPKNIEHLKDEVVLTVCTAGVRCEKASGYLKSKGFKNVYQLKDGIVTYMERFPNKNFEGQLYVFDNRIVMGFETDSDEHVIIGQCEHCQSKSENYINCANDYCHKHYIACKSCVEINQRYCSEKCKQKDRVKA